MKVSNFITEHEEGRVQVSSDISYSTKETINDIYRLYNGFFKVKTDSSGLEKVMLNIAWIVYRTLFYGSDVDTKDMQMRSLNGYGTKILSILRMATVSHLNRSGFGDFIDDVRSDLAVFGSVLIKIVDGKPTTVDLRNAVIPPHESDVQKTGLAERQLWTFDECLARKDEWKNWKMVEELFKSLEKNGGIPQVKIVEFWNKKIEAGEEKKVCTRYIDLSDVDTKTFDEPSSWETHVELEEFDSPHKRRRQTAYLRKKYGEYEQLYPYIYFPFIKVKGRGLGKGVFEMLFGVNGLYQEVWHNGRKLLNLSLKGIFVHKVAAGERSLEQQFLNNLDTGAAVQIGTDEDLTRLGIDPQGSSVLSITDKLFEIARQIVGITAQGAGQDMPSTTTATVAIANKQTQQTTYDFLIERVSILMKQLFQDFYMEQIIEELTEEEVVAITGSTRELIEMDKWLIENIVNQAVIDFRNQTGLTPTREEVDTIRMNVAESLKASGKDRFPEVKKELLNDIDYFVEFYVNNEGFDKAVKIQNMMQMLQMNTSLSREQIEATIIDAMGENAKQFEKTEEEKQRELEMAQAAMMAENAPVNPISNQPQDQQFQFSNAPIRR
ncbi:MAG: hypothetical protein IPO02_11985 [Bacteroidetes bacterium]|nr:hypothetical protein [Bacteroidota bacterium]